MSDTGERVTVTLGPREVQTIQAALDLWTYWHSPLVNHHPHLRQLIAERLALIAPAPLTDEECQEVSDRLSGLVDGPAELLMGPAFSAQEKSE